MTGILRTTGLMFVGGLIALTVAACTSQGMGATGTGLNRDPYEVVMVIDGYDVRRYENDRVVCFSWGSIHGSVTCQDKPR